MSITRIDPPIWMNTPRGDALAHFVIDYGPEADLIWVCFGASDGRIWCWPNQKVRTCRNVTMGRERPERMDDQWPNYIRDIAESRCYEDRDRPARHGT